MRTCFYALILLGSAASVRAETQLRFDASVPAEQSLLLQKDLASIGRLNLPSDDIELLRFMGVANLSQASLETWLGDRVRVVVGASIDPRTSVFALNNSGVNRVGPSPSSLAQVMMTNLGSDLYRRAKGRGVEVGLKTQSLGLLPLRSPRAGVLQVGPGLFAAEMRPMGEKSAPEALGNSLSRLLILFHEGRHSDGRGESLGFNHVPCPSTHWLAGRMACDRAKNGAYAIEGLLTFTAARGCPDCSIEEKEALRAAATDALGRQLADEERDPEEVARVADEIHGLDLEIELLRKGGGLNDPATASRIAELENRKRVLSASGAPGGEWDATPEGTF